MKKNYQRGFVLAEAFIVSTFVLGVLVFMFLQIKTIINGYDKSFTYNTITGIYQAREVKKFIEDNDYVTLIEQINEHDFIVLDNTNTTYTNIFNIANIKTVVISKGDLSSLKMESSLSPKFKNYIKTLANTDYYKLIFEFNDDTFATIKG